MTDAAAAPPDAAAGVVPPPLPKPIDRPLAKIAIAAALLALADYLFFQGSFGISIGIFALAVAGGAWLAQRERPGPRHAATGVVAAFLGALPSAVELSLLAALFAVLGAGLAALAFSGKLEQSAAGLARQLLRLFGFGPFQVVADAARAPQAIDVGRARALSRSLVLTWAVPLLLGGVFLILFASANPLFDRWLGDADRFLQSLLNPIRMVFWAVVLAVVWPFVNLRLKAPRASAAPGIAAPAASLADLLMSDAAILRSLILFNLIFAAQTAMDAAYLSNGLALPAGMTYAGYAHRGAYPLVVTALLAAAFVLVALRDGGTAERSPLLRRLLYLFVGQNILLVLSSIYRLKIYVEAYSLTLLRVSAFIWMALVALGLALILVRMLARKDNAWLVGCNLAMLVVTLYACAFVNFARLIGDWNVDHRHTIGRVDVGYIASFGAQAIPSLDRYIARIDPDPFYDAHRLHVGRIRNLRAKYFLRGSAPTWQSWTLRDRNIRRYLHERPVVPESTVPGVTRD